MNRFFVLAIAGCIASAALSAPAYAGPILPDPTIGVRGADSGSPPVTDGSAQTLQPCSTLATTVDLTGIGSFFCAPFEFTGLEGYGPTINSFDLAFWDNTGAAIEVVCPEGCNFFASAQSQFQGIAPVEGSPFVVRLSAVLSEFCEVCDSPISGPRDLLLFVEEAAFNGGFVSIQAINGDNTFQTNLATPGQPVPEPATLFLMGSGLVGLVTRERLRRRRPAA